MDLTTIKTNTGKTLQDFRIPAKLLQNGPELVDLIMRSESMDDEERQYWFNLSEVMNDQQAHKLRDILTRERQKLAEIEAKYAAKKVDPAEARRRAQELAQKRAQQRAHLAAQERAHESAEAEAEADILKQLEQL